MQRELEFIEGMQFKNKSHTLNLTEHEGIIHTWLICVDCAFQADCWAELSTVQWSDFTAWFSGLYEPLETLVVFQSRLVFWKKLGLQLRLEEIGDSVQYLMKPVYCSILYR